MQRSQEKTGLQAFGTSEPLRLMVRPKEKVGVSIVTAVHDASIASVERLIEIWPNLKLRTFIQGNGCTPLEDVNSKVDIVLVDEPLDQITGAEMVEILHENIYVGLVASIRSGEKPAWAKFHFGGKNALSDSNRAKEKFIEWMNYLIDEVQAIRLH